ncbi:hypothetical protein MPER_12297, partial [Moniliophthora perniciosa FA553]
IALATNSLYVTESHYDDIFDFTPLVLAIAGLTFMLVAISLILTVFLRQPFLTRICVELVWSGFLWLILYVPAAYGADPFCEVHPALNGLSFVLALLLRWSLDHSSHRRTPFFSRRSKNLEHVSERISTQISFNYLITDRFTGDT